MLQSLSYLCGPRNTTYTSIHNCTDIGQFVQQQENVEDKLYVGQAGLSEAVYVWVQDRKAAEKHRTKMYPRGH